MIAWAWVALAGGALTTILVLAWFSWRKRNRKVLVAQRMPSLVNAVSQCSGIHLNDFGYNVFMYAHDGELMYTHRGRPSSRMDDRKLRATPPMMLTVLENEVLIRMKIREARESRQQRKAGYEAEIERRAGALLQ